MSVDRVRPCSKTSKDAHSQKRRHRRESERSVFSADSGYGSRRGRNDSESSNIVSNIEQQTPSIEKDGNGNNVPEKRYLFCREDFTNQNVTHHYRNSDEGDVVVAVNGTDGNKGDCSSVYLSGISEGGSECDRSSVFDHLLSCAADENGNISDSNNELNGTGQANVEKNAEEFRLDTERNNNKCHTHKYERHIGTPGRPSSSGKTRSSSHRKSLSCSNELINENEQLYLAKRRKRYKSEGNETERLLQAAEQPWEAVDCSFQGGTDLEDGLVDPIDERLQYRVVPGRETNEDSGSSVQLDKQIGFEKTFTKPQLHESVSYPNIGSELTDHGLNVRKKPKTYNIFPPGIFDAAEANHGSLTVNIDKNDFDHRMGENNTCSTVTTEGFCELKRTGCCGDCSKSYAEFLSRIDSLTNDYQWQSKRIEEAVLNVRKLREFFIKVLMVGIVIFTTIVCVGTAVVLVRGLLGADNLFDESFSRNITAKVTDLHEQYEAVSDMVSDIMTRTTSVIRLTNSGTFSQNGNTYYVKWKAREHEGQGSLSLSDRSDAVIVSSGGFYAIYTKIHFKSTLRNGTSLKLEYDVVRKLGDGAARSMHHAVMEIPTVNGSLQQELHSQITEYVHPGDEIRVGVRQDQLPHLARFQEAHQFSMFEVD